MANLPETPQWESGIYQIEVSDPVLGGPDGISNRQAKQLASRTSYLKQKVEKSGTDLAAHIAAVDPHTQYATKASPTFTGTPTAPTPANGDNSKKLATTEFVAKALAALAGSAPETLDTLKELADALGNDPNFATTVLNKLAEKLAKDQNGADIPDPELFVKNLGLGEAAKLGAAVGVTGNTGRILIPALIGGVEQNIIFQWVSGFLSDSTGVATVTLPMAFPNALFHATAIDSGASASSWNGSAGTTWGFDIGGSTRTTVKLRVLRTTNGTSWAGASAAGCLFAIGY
ncbi:gp53-like domain-containing protein [Escherichia coli]